MTKGNGTVREALCTFGYRGPDAMAEYADEHITLGHLRLSIIDPDARSNQPFFNSSRDIGIVFNGEIYNYAELRDELTRVHGVTFATESDTEVLVEGYAVWHEDLLPRLRGMFAFCIYDKKDKNVFLARDHAGIKPLYYAIENTTVYFASEMKGVISLLRESDFLPELSEEAVGLYLALGYIPSPLTLCENVKKIERGSWLRFSIENGSAEHGSWRPDTPPVESMDSLEDAVRDSIVEHTVADVPVGVFFSGGIDSSVVALTLKEAGMDLATYSVRVEGRSEDEPYFNEIAKRIGIRAHVIDFGLKEFEEMFDHVLSRMDDPISDASVFPTSLVSRAAARDVKVVLSGEGGDELFCGYPRALAVARMGSAAEKARWFDSLVLKTPNFKGKRALLGLLSKSANLPVSYYLTQSSLAFDRTPESAWRASRALLTRTDPLWFDRDWYLENDLMRKLDMATMYSSIEGRVPLLGAELWNTAPRFFGNNAQGMGKTLLRKMLKAKLPENLIDRPKAGFGIPLASLYERSDLFRDAYRVAIQELGKLPALARIKSDAPHSPALALGLIALHRSLQNTKLL